jgi:hypothetical protein
MNRLLASPLVAVGLLCSVTQGAVVITSLQQNSYALAAMAPDTQRDLNTLLPPRDTYASAKLYFYRTADTEAIQDIQSYTGPLDFLSPSPQLQLSADLRAGGYRPEADIAQNIFQLMFTLNTSHPYQYTATSDPASAIKFTGPGGSIASNTSGTLLPGSYQLLVQQSADNESFGILDPNDTTTFSLSILAVPEPTTLCLLAMGAISLFGHRHR